MPSSDPSADPFELVGETVAGKYVVERVAWRNSFSVVYQARHAELQTRVALKVLVVPKIFYGEQRKQFLERFAQEARTIATLNHPAIARVIDFGEAELPSGRTPWMALEWLDGRTLEADLAERPGGRRSPREALDLLRPAFDALACAHEAGIAHRDVKPSNMMLVRSRPGDAGLRILDFGIAKVMEPDERAGTGDTATLTEVGAYSPLYAAPEQVNRSRTGPWTDVHALALVLVELLLGRPAYQSVEGTELLTEVLDRERPTPGHHKVDVGRWEPVLARALSPRPLDRHGSAAELLAALDDELDDAQSAWSGRKSPSGLAKTVLSVGSPDPLSEPDSVSFAPIVVVRHARGRAPLWVALGVSLSAVVALVAYAASRPNIPSPAQVSVVPTPVQLSGSWGDAAVEVSPPAPVVAAPVVAAPVVAAPEPAAVAPAPPPLAPAPEPRVTLVAAPRRAAPAPAPVRRAQGAPPPTRHIVIE